VLELLVILPLTELLAPEPEPGLLDRVAEVREADPFSHLEPIPLEVKQERERREEEERQAEQERAAEARQAAAREEAARAEEESQASEATTGEVPEEVGTDYAKWEPIARCESGYGGPPQWGINTGNGYYGGLQFALSSWQWVGGEGYPHHASKEEQIKRAEILLERQGWRAWPACSKKVGYR